jgi:hypothetical protein
LNDAAVDSGRLGQLDGTALWWVHNRDPRSRRSASPARAFTEAGYTNLEQLIAADPEELLALHGVGPKAIRILHEEAVTR